MQNFELTVDDERHEGMRVDRYVADVLGLVSRSQLKRRDAAISINGRPAKLSRSIAPGDHLSISLPPLEEISLDPEPMDLEIIYEDARMLAVNKPAGLVVHPGNGHPRHTLVHGVLAHLRTTPDQVGGDAIRPGIVHRLDKDTSGVIVVAKDPEAHEELSRQFHDRETGKLYLAVIHGRLTPSRGELRGTIFRDPDNRKRFAFRQGEGDATGPGKYSHSSYVETRRWGNYALVALTPHTGRTHQLRVHLRSLGAPILGDPIYARRDARFPDVRLMLHAYRLRIRPPGQERSITLRAPIPADFRDLLCRLSSPG